MRQLKTGYFVLEGINSFATTSYIYYLFFFLSERFQFGDRQNLCVGALHGFAYMFSAWFGGKFAQKHGYFFSLKLGFIVMAVMLLISSQVASLAGLMVCLVIWTIGMCFTWPTLEGLVAENESPRGLQSVIGIYNIVWAGASGLAYFVGGAMHDQLGAKSMFWVPLGLHVGQLGLVCWLERQSTHLIDLPANRETEKRASSPHPSPPREERGPASERPRPITEARLFLRLAWIANPFAYIAINTVIPVIPSVAKKLGLSPMAAGFVCSLWFFARLATFLGLWLWSGWHYRFRYFVGAFILLLVCFTALLLTSNFSVLLLAQLGFGVALGLIYYSSLFYSMDVGETKGEHGGFHEATIGVGIFAGPAIGAASLYAFPALPHSGIWAVSGLLFVGLVVILAMRGKGRGAGSDL